MDISVFPASRNPNPHHQTHLLTATALLQLDTKVLGLGVENPFESSRRSFLPSFLPSFVRSFVPSLARVERTGVRLFGAHYKSQSIVQIEVYYCVL